MLHGLYRVYLYIVYIAMLIFAAIGLGMFLQTILAQTLFQDPYNVLTSANVVQSGTFAVVSLLIAALVGGLHYWLIRRDMRNDPTASGGAVRAFFLNFTEILTLPLAVGIGAFTISQLGQAFSSVSGLAAFTISSLALWVWLDWERRRTQPNSGAANVFQRIHLYGTQLILLFILSTNWIPNVGQLVDSLFYGGKGSGTPTCVGFTVCPQGPNLLSLAASTLFIALFWLWYGYLSRNDTASLFRRVFHFIGYGFGFIFVLTGVYRIFTLLLLIVLKVPLTPGEISGSGAQYDIISPLSLGLITGGVYFLWLRRTVKLHPSTKVSITLSMQAITSALMGFVFWWGCGLLLLNILEKIAPSNTPLTTESWAYAIAFILTGAGYIPLDILLRRRSTQTTSSLPLRGFVFALLGSSILAIAIGGAVALYAYSTSILGSPLDNWLYTAHIGLATFITGVIVAALYLWTGVHGGIFARHSQPTQPVAGTTTEPVAPVVPSFAPSITTTPAKPLSPTVPVDTHSSTIGNILDDLLAGTISRDEALARIVHSSEQPA
ncbi:MAG: DUF5671 domain-containing protein [Ktedonobacteraceae bacterium]